ncbi:hypothetical protein [Neolewinella agarilytica]|uniref:Uncharacterized protein n=1 Tax=Neolewinella agarilytica TaxID=478744 RepID=A0A1H9LYJ3_9BACT|nr:hypothetical protein [Neolewinella agarilytica]SER16492.1 hypothetical protein SAMN05444359_12639 [Neolewinella agarilytica]
MGLFSNKFSISTAAISANGQWRSFSTLMRLLNGGLTFAFGFTYGAYMIPTGHPTASAILGGIAFALIYDVAAFGWDAAARRDGISPEQRLMSENMSGFSMWSSTAISAVQLALTTPLVDLSSMYDGIGMTALALSTILLASHFVTAFNYKNASPETMEARIDSELQSTLAAMYRQQRTELAMKVTERVAERMIDNIDQFAEAEAAREWKRITTNMGQAEMTMEARTQVQAKVKGNEGPPPAPPADDQDSNRPLTDEEKLAEVSKPFTDDAYIEFEELRGNAQAAQENNLNMAAG